MFGLDTSEIREMERDLKTFATKAYPFATRNTVNDAAFQAQSIARVDVRHRMVNRNRFTVRSIQVERAKSLRVKSQIAAVGSIAPYMEDQEFGAVKMKPVIPTSYSAGMGDYARPRTKLPRKPNRMANIRLQRRHRKGTSRKQKNLIAIKQAIETGNRYVFLDLGRTKGIFKVIGSKHQPIIKMMHDISRPSVVIPKNPWLAPAFEEAKRMLPAFYAHALRFQLRRHGLFR